MHIISGLRREIEALKVSNKQLLKQLCVWLCWSFVVHFAWLSKWYLYPLTLLALTPLLYWMIKHEVEKTYEQILNHIKVFYETLAAQVGCGMSLQKGLLELPDYAVSSEAVPRALKPSLERLLLEAKIGWISGGSFEGLNRFSKMKMLEQFSDLLDMSIKSGSSIENLLTYVADQLSELQKFRRLFKEKLSEKRSEFEVMLLVPVLAVIGVRGTMGDYFNVLYESTSGLVLLFMVTLMYSFSCDFFFRNESGNDQKEKKESQLDALIFKKKTLEKNNSQFWMKSAPILLNRTVMMLHSGSHPRQGIIEGFRELPSQEKLNMTPTDVINALQAGMPTEGIIRVFGIASGYKPLTKALQRIALYEKTGNELILNQIDQDLSELYLDNHNHQIQLINKAGLKVILPSVINLLIMMILFMAPMLIGGFNV